MEFAVKNFSELDTHELYDILAARARIFTVEKGMRCLDPDGMDKDALHCILKDGGDLAGYIRALPCEDGVRIGRVITLTHGMGHGRMLMDSAVRYFKDAGYDIIYVHAQHDAVGFYEKMGFTLTSGEFIEEGVVHFAMELKLN